jgi:GNAT superfamily N-acetyltransferase
MHFREAVEADIPAMTAVRLGVRENQFSDPNWLTWQAWLDGLARSGNANTWVCEMGESVVGFSVARIRESDIWALFVDPAFEAMGIGKRLLNLATDWLFAHGVREIHLSTSANSRAAAFYRHRGWTHGGFNANGEVVYRLRSSGGSTIAQPCEDFS